MKKHFDGIWKNVKDLMPETLLFYFLTGDSKERLESEKEIIRRLKDYDKLRLGKSNEQ